MVIPHFRGEGTQAGSSQDTKLVRARAELKTLVRATRPIPEASGSPAPNQGSNCALGAPEEAGKENSLVS